MIWENHTRSDKNHIQLFHLSQTFYDFYNLKTYEFGFFHKYIAVLGPVLAISYGGFSGYFTVEATLRPKYSPIPA
jgi:hypothetical protein